ncbi:hypothetical protein [Actinoplanes couchii]|uniref:MarR family transcriptional regulator n=1 Tax=Actinoplanes couchii TaxID=403638 RepID=A0ABQ3XT06_9ACTN|nr:hypothetical protein [Actinoplanes couchii]MDR6324033.1 hypothetical protein [Actinoplanes couchii]GID61560.1 hypothetical protein Aco03nite_099640 [Actinoplanes couchii]
MSDTMSALHRVLTALAILGEATPSAIAGKAGLGYSTVPPKLRQLETDELAARTTDSAGKALWTLTPKGVLAAAVTPDAGTAELLTPDGALPGETPAKVDTEAKAVTGIADEGDNATSALADVGQMPQEQPTTTEAATGRSEASPETGPTAEAVIAAAAELQPEPEDTPADSTSDDAPEDVTETPHRDAAGTTETPHPDDEDSTATADGPSLHEGPVSTSDTAPGLATEDPGDAGEAAEGPSADSSSGEPLAVADAPSEPVEQAAVTPSADAEDAAGGEEKPRRPAGQLRAEVLQILTDNPGETFKVSQMCKAITEASEGPKKQLSGSVANALAKLANDGQARIIAEKPATYQAI